MSFAWLLVLGAASPDKSVVTESANRARIFSSYTERAASWRSTGRFKGTNGLGNVAISGRGSEPALVGPFMTFLRSWLEARGVRSIVEASAGHWPTGWQREMAWPALSYRGLDLLPMMVEDNQELLKNSSDRYGLRDARFEIFDMLQRPLDPADVLLTKDTLIHFSNRDILKFLHLSVLPCPPRFKHVLFVHDQVSKPPSPGDQRVNNQDIPHLNSFHPLNLSAPPFNLQTETVFQWDPRPASKPASGAAKPRPALRKVVELLTGLEGRCMTKAREQKPSLPLEA